MNIHAATHRPLGPTTLVLTVLFGVMLPVIALAVELASSMCAGTLFDPLPTILHVVLVALVPVANGVAIVSLRSASRPAWKAAGWMNGVAIGVSGYYAVLFAIVTPFAVIGILFFGLGFLPLAPLLSLACALVLRGKLRGAARDERRPAPAAVWKLAAAGLALLAFASLPRVVTLTGVHWAASEDASLRARGYRVLRHYGNEQELLRSAYLRRPIELELWGWVARRVSEPVSQSKVQEIYYRVTGHPYNSVRPPPLRGRKGTIFDEAEWDFDQAADRVASRVRGLSLAQSRLDGRIEAAAGVTYVEWIMIFRNDSAMQREARAQILLPPGGSISRLTLWINGEEREAAYGGRAQVREAYQRVVERRRDPVLVTTVGRDRVLVQCFPVPPSGGEMKVRLGITAPLAPRSPGEGALALPRILESNFGPAATLQSAVWIESDGAFAAAPGLIAEAETNKPAVARGDLPGASIEDGYCLRVQRPTGIGASWCRDDRDPANTIVVQRLVSSAGRTPGRVAVVVDGSARMAGRRDDLGAILKAFPSGIEARIFLASDETVEEAFDPASVISWIRDIRFAGGCDNVAALVRAWDWAAENEGGTVLWLHGTQPLASDSAESLRQRFERRVDGPRLNSYQFGGGPDRVSELFADSPVLHVIPPLLGTADDLAGLLATWAGKGGELSWERSKLAGNSAVPAGAVASSTHLIRLWAVDEVCRRAAERSKDAVDDAIALARKWQVVTPVTGAVVLETQEQYKSAGLEDIDPATAPSSIPEPGLLWLLLTGVAVLWLTRRVAHGWKRRFAPSKTP
jgi:hypothetical protein